MSGLFYWRAALPGALFARPDRVRENAQGTDAENLGRICQELWIEHKHGYCNYETQTANRNAHKARNDNGEQAPYAPISCSGHDQLLAFATLRKQCRLTVSAEDGTPAE